MVAKVRDICCGDALAVAARCRQRPVLPSQHAGGVLLFDFCVDSAAPGCHAGCYHALCGAPVKASG